MDLLLMRTRSESELATLMSEVERLRSLDEIWKKSREPRLLPCSVRGADDDGAERPGGGGGGGIVLRNVQYSRGTASVSVEHLMIGPGIYAVTGGKKTYSSFG